MHLCIFVCIYDLFLHSNKITCSFSYESKVCFLPYFLPLAVLISCLPSLPSYLFHSQSRPSIHPNNISHPDLFWSWSHVTLNIVTDPGCIDLPVQASTATSCLITTVWNYHYHHHPLGKKSIEIHIYCMCLYVFVSVYLSCLFPQTYPHLFICIKICSF